MNITCYKCGQVGHIWTNCPCLTKVRMAAVRADGTEDPEMDPQEDDEALPPDKEGVLLSPEFTRATGIKTFALEKPIALQLACIGS